MTVFEQLSESQQKVLLLQNANRGTCKSLARKGLITFSESAETRTRMVELTDLGQMVLFAHSQRENTTTKFKTGDRVVALDFSPHNGAWEFAGRECTVYSVGARFVTLTGGIGQDRRNAWNLAHARSVEKAGLLHLVRKDPAEVRS